MLALSGQEKFDVVIHLAAQAGVRYSLTNPEEYIQSNIVGFLNILECCRFHPVKHLVYASSSSVYGANEKMPFSTSDSVDHPVSLYAASKKSNELMAHTYSHLFGIPTTGLRFFTVYGPWGRPDMALFLFTEAILKGEKIQVFNYGNMKRDFTFIDDIVAGVIKVADRPATPNQNFDPQNPDPGSAQAPYKVYNIGNSAPVLLMDYIKAVEKGLGKKALHFLKENVAESRDHRIILNVNIKNPAIKIYESQGFVIFHKEAFDIGNGYVMDDYLMEFILD